MDSERNDQSQPPSSQERPTAWQPPPAYAPYPVYPAPVRRRSIRRIFAGVLFGLSVLASVILFLLVIGAIAMVVTGGGMDQRVVLRSGPRDSKIVVLDVGGLIDGSAAELFQRRLRAVRRDTTVKGLIVRVDSPGGTVSGSDRIYKEILDYRREKALPAVAFLQGMATSGGYYAAVACDQIVAEPTVITGSIGVAMVHFVFQGLLEDKLGIQPVFQTMGEKKDWPSLFRTPTQAEFAYLRERLLEPAYRRFVSVVQEGRKEVLGPAEVEKLADGGVFPADLALEVKLIDKIGYLDEAIAAVKSRAGIERAQVVGYRRPVSFLGLLSSKGPTIPRLDRTTLFDLGTPQVMYLWSAY